MNTRSTRPHPPRRDIQGLRALAVLAVIGAHAMGWPRGGFVGVDVFFVISGFVITASLLREVQASGTVHLGAFALRRVRRILPAALVVLAATSLAAVALFNTARAEQTLGDAVWSALIAANWRFAAAGTDYFTADAAVSPLQHYWSLSVEEQFYLVWPLLVLACALLVPVALRRGAAARWAIGCAAAVLAAASFAWALAQTGSAPTVAYFSTLTRVWELGVGAVLAAAAPALARLPRPIGVVAGWVGLAGVVVSFVVIEPDGVGFPAPWAALPVAAAALILAGGCGSDPRQRHLFPLSNRLSTGIGDMSYSLYLWHLPVIVFAAVVLPATAAAAWLTAAAIAVLSVASYVIVEQPLRAMPFALLGRHRPAAASAPTPSRTTGTDAAAAHTRARAATRPAGWTPGSRFYAESARALGPAPTAVPVAASPPQPAAASSTAIAASPAGPTEPASASEPASAEEPAPSPWASWRARFGPRVLAGVLGLAMSTLAMVLVAQLTLGVSVIRPLAPPVAAAEPAADPLALVQSELADAAAATSWPELHPPLDEVIARSSTSNPARDCFSPETTPDAARCSTGSADAPTHIYLVGDSTAMAYAPTFRRMADDSGGAIRVTTVGLYGCRFTDIPVDNDGPGVMAACPQRKNDVRAMIAADAPSFVVIANAYTLGHTPEGIDLTAGMLLDAQQAEADAYGMPGRIVHLAPPPEGADLGRCYSRVSSPYDCAAGISTVWTQMQAAAEGVAAATGDSALSSLPFSCWEGVCPAFAGDIPTKYDRTHMTVAYAERIAPVMRAELEAVGLL